MVGRPVRLTVSYFSPFRLEGDLDRFAEWEVGHVDPRAFVEHIGRRDANRGTRAREGDLSLRPWNECRRAYGGKRGERQDGDGARKGEAALHRQPTLHEIHPFATSIWTENGAADTQYPYSVGVVSNVDPARPAADTA